MPAHRLSAKKRAALQNLKKATEQRKAKALERFIDKVRRSGEDLEKQIQQMHKRLPELAHDQLVKMLEKQPRKDLAEIFKRIPFEVLEAVGSKERWIEIIGRTRSKDKDIQRIQDREYMNLINICASLAKAQIERVSPAAGQPMMVVQIIGREETPCDITISSLPQSVPPS
jgi:TolA-binding protein